MHCLWVRNVKDWMRAISGRVTTPSADFMKIIAQAVLNMDVHNCGVADLAFIKFFSSAFYLRKITMDTSQPLLGPGHVSLILNNFNFNHVLTLFFTERKARYHHALFHLKKKAIPKKSCRAVIFVNVVRNDQAVFENVNVLSMIRNFFSEMH